MISSSRGCRPNDLPPRVMLAAGRLAWLEPRALRVQDGAAAARRWPLERPAGLTLTPTGDVVAIAAPPRGDAEVDVLRVARDGSERSGRLFTYLDATAFLFPADEAETWLLATSREPELIRFVLDERSARAVAALPIGLPGPTAAIRLPGGDFVLSSAGALLRATPPRVRAEGGAVREISDADWQRDLRQLQPLGPHLLARGPSALHVLDGTNPTLRLAHLEVAGESLHRIAGARNGAVALCCARQSADGPRWSLSGYDAELRGRWRRELGARWGWEPLDLTLDDERVVVLGGDGKPAVFDAATGEPREPLA